MATSTAIIGTHFRIDEEFIFYRDLEYYIEFIQANEALFILHDEDAFTVDANVWTFYGKRFHRSDWEPSDANDTLGAHYELPCESC